MENDKNGYYDIDCDVETILIENGLLDEIFKLKDLRQRKLFINGDIDGFLIDEIVRHIMQYNKEDRGLEVGQRQPILLYISSNGGDIDVGFELIDVIQSSITPVYTINCGFQYSMGFLVGLAGHQRFATKNAKFLMHDGHIFEYGSGAKVQDRMAFQKQIEDRIKEYVLSKSKLTSEEYDSKFRIEWYMFADEAKEKGFTDFIVGEDCDIDKIV